jgi:hypothetical protein
MSHRVKDEAGKALIVLFLIKPLIDLFFWEQSLYLGALRISALHVTGVFVCIYFGAVLLRSPGGVPRYGSLFLLFFVLNIISIGAGLFNATNPNLIRAVDLLLRIFDSYLIFRVAYNAGIKERYATHYKYILAVAAGTSIVLTINTIAIAFGWGGETAVVRLDEEFTRKRGLYYDPGILGLVATFNIIFVSFLYKQIPKGKPLWRLLVIVMVLVGMYMVYISVSRAAVVLLVVFALIYVGLVQKGFQKIMTLAFIALALVISSVLFTEEIDRYRARFDSEIQVLESSDTAVQQDAGDDRVSFGRYETLGSNRVRLWAMALNMAIDRSAAEIVIGNFFARSPSHSDYFDILIRNGFVGLFVYVLLLFLIWKRTLTLALKRGNTIDEKVIHSLAFTLITLYILYAFPFRPLAYTTTSWYMWAMIGFSFACARVRELELRKKAAEVRATPNMPEAPKSTPPGSRPAAGALGRGVMSLYGKHDDKRRH